MSTHRAFAYEAPLPRPGVAPHLLRMDGVEVAGCRVHQRLSVDLFRAVELATGRPVVLRYLAGQKAKTAPRALERACALEHSRLADSRCLRIDGGGLLHLGGLFHIREWLGETLSDVARQSSTRGVRLSPACGQAVVAWIQQLADALDWAHRRGVVHGRLHPGCVRFGADGQLRVTELGCAAVSPRVPMAGWSVAAPEALVAPAAPLDPRLDVYGLGLVLLEQLTGRLPFERDSAELTLAAVLGGDIPRSVWQRVPKPFREVCRRALAADPDRRWSSLAELGQATEAAAIRLGWRDQVRRRAGDSAAVDGPTSRAPDAGQLNRWFRALR